MRGRGIGGGGAEIILFSQGVILELNAYLFANFKEIMILFFKNIYGYGYFLK